MALNTSIVNALTEQESMSIIEKSIENPAEYSIKELTMERPFTEQQYKEIDYTVTNPQTIRAWARRLLDDINNKFDVESNKSKTFGVLAKCLTIQNICSVG